MKQKKRVDCLIICLAPSKRREDVCRPILVSKQKL